MSCGICISDYNRSVHSCVHCEKCAYEACKMCVRQYVLSETGKCMNCREEWSKEFMTNALGKTWMNQEYKKHVANQLAEKSIAKKEENIRGAMIYQALRNQNEVNVYLEQEPEPEKEVKVKFTMPCQNGGCRGMLHKLNVNEKETYYCVICTKSTCPSCLEIMSNNHECKKETVETVKAIENETKPCPKCGERIAKTDGCDQMWCITCKTAFSWTTGNIEHGKIHNPHYYEYMRENGGMPRDIMDTRNPDINKALQWMCKKRRLPGTNVEQIDYLIKFMEYESHISEVIIPRLSRQITAKRENKVADYKYILGEIEKEQLGKELVKKEKSLEKDEEFYEIYGKVVKVLEEMAKEIATGNRNVEHHYNVVKRVTTEINRKLIETLIKHDSKRIIVLFAKGKKRERQYIDIDEMKRDLHKASLW